MFIRFDFFALDHTASDEDFGMDFVQEDEQQGY